MTIEEIVIVVLVAVVIGGIAVWGARVARTSRADQTQTVAAIQAHFAGIAERTGLSLSPGPGEALPSMWGEMGGFTVRMTTALMDDLQCEIVVEAPASLRWRPHEALHRGPPPELSPAARDALERVRRRARRLDVAAGALHCTLVSIEMRVPAMPELLADLVVVAGALPRA